MGSGSSKSSKRVVIIGAGNAGRQLAAHMDGKVELILIEQNPYVIHHNAALRATVQGAEYARTIVAPVPTIVPNGRAVLGSITDFSDTDVTVLKPDGTTENIGFDYAVICTGSSYTAPGKLALKQPKAVVEYYGQLSATLAKSKHVVIVGGGPVGIEFAGEIAAQYGSDVKVTLAHRGPKLFSGAWTSTTAGQVADGPAAYAKTRLEGMGVEVLLNTGVVPPPAPPTGGGAAAAEAAAGQAPSVNTATDGKATDKAPDAKDGELATADAAEDKPAEGGGAADSKGTDPVAAEPASAGEQPTLPFGEGVTLPADKKVSTTAGAQLDADIVFWCTGATPNTQWLRTSHSDLLDERGFVKVDAHLRVLGKEHIFCLGDCAGSGDQKLAYRAMEQTDKVVFPNLQALIAAADAGKDSSAVQLKSLEVGKPAAVVSFGPEHAMADLGGFSLCECLVVRMKARDLFRKEFKEQTHGTAADDTDWAAQGVPGWDLPPPAAGQAK